MLLLGGTLNAHADNDVYDNITNIRAAMTCCRPLPIIARRCLARRKAVRRPRRPTKAACADGDGATVTRCASAQRETACTPTPIIPG